MKQRITLLENPIAYRGPIGRILYLTITKLNIQQGPICEFSYLTPSLGRNQVFHSLDTKVVYLSPEGLFYPTTTLTLQFSLSQIGLVVLIHLIYFRFFAMFPSPLQKQILCPVSIVCEIQWITYLLKDLQLPFVSLALFIIHVN